MDTVFELKIQILLQLLPKSAFLYYTNSAGILPSSNSVKDSSSNAASRIAATSCSP